jgi:hypothetical protein
LKGAVDRFSATLVVLSMGIAGATKTPEVEIDKSEGDLLASSLVNLAAQFDFEPDPKAQAIIATGVAFVTVAFPRVVMYRARKAQERKEKTPGTAGVYDASGNPLGTTTFQEQ